MNGPGVSGIVLAAGAGIRFGGPKGLARTADGVPWIARAVDVLDAAGCGRILVVLGAAADAAAELVPDRAQRILAEDWAEGMSASLRAGLRAVDGAAVIVPVDTPGMPVAAVVRVLGALDPATGLARAVYDGRPGHPVGIGAAHRESVAASVAGDRGAHAYLVAHGAVEVECGDLWSGTDIDSR